MSNYIQEAAELVKKHYDGEMDDQFAGIYGLCVLWFGGMTDLELVHDAWSAVRYPARPDHPSMVPFEELSPDVQALDQPFVDAIRAAARELYGAVSA